MSRHSLDRRTLLRGILAGAAVSVALPLLEIMLDEHGTALASGEPIPKKFGMWFFGNGVSRKAWNPQATGSAWELTPSLATLADVKNYVSIVTNTWIPGHLPTQHWSQFGALRRASESGGEAVDDKIVEHLGMGAKKKSLDVRISRVVNGNYATDDAQSFPGESDPKKLWQELFLDYVPSQTRAPDPGQLDAKKSVLDVVMQDAKSLRSRLGSADRIRLDAHLEHVAAIESKLAPPTAIACGVPPEPSSRTPDGAGLHEPLVEVNQAMSDLIAYALACDLARSFRVAFTYIQGFTVFSQVGSNQNHHELGHDESPETIAMIEKIAAFTIEQLAYLLNRMQQMQVGAGNLLDHSAVWVTSEIDEPNRHDTFSIPTLIVGKAGGALKAGQHYRAPGIPDGNKKADVPDAIHARVLLTLMRALGLPDQEFGSGTLRATTAIPELLS